MNFFPEEIEKQSRYNVDQIINVSFVFTGSEDRKLLHVNIAWPQHVLGDKNWDE